MRALRAAELEYVPGVGRKGVFGSLVSWDVALLRERPKRQLKKL